MVYATMLGVLGRELVDPRGISRWSHPKRPSASALRDVAQ
jgi:hypothetical protein